MKREFGKRVYDLTGVLDAFDAQEGVVEMIIGKTGMGKTYYATLRALKFLYNGYVVYTTWRLNLPEYYDEREHWWPVIRNFIFRRKDFYRINLRENWKYVDLKSFDDEKGIFDTAKFSEFLATRTDCIFMLDEGQDVFDSHSKTTKLARQSITRTRHMHKTLIVIAQRAQAVDVTARGNVESFYRCEKRSFFGYNYFRVRRTEDIDDAANYPIWIRHDSQGRIVWRAQVWYSGFASKRVYDAYDSWYMRQEQVKSQDLKIDAYELDSRDRWMVFMGLIFRKKLSTGKEKTVDKSENTSSIMAEYGDVLAPSEDETYKKPRTESIYADTVGFSPQRKGEQATRLAVVDLRKK